ncbi:hypothetical protein EVG20_g2417 [Dentipellis fragilis]|uniref:Secreted protein n=1 Tax=Dentipellis fragilis TaxID=205917 RepID=A0A4Y9Z992_9AGAM|nr:hypothetical protein EVG20_g2417 [Dentipellis fragilis]
MASALLLMLSTHRTCSALSSISLALALARECLELQMPPSRVRAQDAYDLCSGLRFHDAAAGKLLPARRRSRSTFSHAEAET